MTSVAYTKKNTVILPNFLVSKFCGKAPFPHSFWPIASISTGEIAEIQIGDCLIKDCNHEKLLGVKIDNKFNFRGHVNVFVKKQAVNSSTLLE